MFSIGLHLGAIVPRWTLQKTLATTSAAAALLIKVSRELFKMLSTTKAVSIWNSTLSRSQVQVLRW